MCTHPHVHACMRIKGQGDRVRVHLDRPDPERERKFNDFECRSENQDQLEVCVPRALSLDDVKRNTQNPCPLNGYENSSRG